ncbi:MAG: tRNA (adenosine(37)-N6)-dimethylallyltransferase MiaA [Leptolyngbyaceae bacterium]|nr:tRNA (adenosine(37)-N6)-dimethylallyltransferase MiaA [Leptolyngbyaceae bacterium]
MIVPSLIVICGPTATGKSGLAIALAQRLNTVILSADSRQVYQQFDIGTAKPTIAEQQQIPHYLIDICSPQVTLTVAEYQQQAQALITQIHQGQWHPSPNLPPSPPLPLLVGGTGLYIRSIVRGLRIPQVSPQPGLRSQLQSFDQTYLYALLQQVDPKAAQRIHPHDPTSTIRALEVFYTTGQPISDLQGEYPPRYPILQIGLDCPDAQALTQRIAHRTEQMLALGLVDEVKALIAQYGADLPLLETLGYREIKQYLAEEVSLAAAQELIVVHTRQFAKRQRTWFRADPEIEWFDADQPDLLDQVWQRIQMWGC